MSETEPAPGGLPDAAGRPVLFLHIPQTGDAAVLSAFQILFGDDQVLRLNGVDQGLAPALDGIVANRLDELSCVAGHVPVHVLAPHLERFRPLTLLRHPVARVFSLYRFLRRAPEADPAAMGLPPEFDFEAFVGSRNPDMFAQVNNAMCRMLCGDARLSDPTDAAFWRIDPDPALVEQALANLEQFEFGLAEDMAATWALLRARWRLPDTHRDFAEATEAWDDGEATAHRLQMVIRRNMLDLALYQRAATLFQARVGGAAASGQAIFAPGLDQTVAAAEIPGLQGFEPAEHGDAAWLRADQPARIHFRAPPGVARIRMRLYALTADYPIGRIIVSVNGEPATLQAGWSEPHWFELMADGSGLRSEANVIAIDPPVFLSGLQSDSPDEGHLAVALADIALLGP